MKTLTQRTKYRQQKSCWNKLMMSGLCATLILISWNPGCKPKPPAKTESQEPNAPTAVVETLVDPNSVAVTVNGIDITEGEVQEMMGPRLEIINAKASQWPPAYVEQTRKQLRLVVLEQLITELILNEKVKQEGIQITEQEVLEKIKEVAAAQDTPLSLEDFKTKMEQYGQSFDQVKQQVKRLLGYERLLQAQWSGKIEVTEEDARKYYAENTEAFITPEQVRTSHILIRPRPPTGSEADVDPNEARANARAKAQVLLEQIKAGADFAELAKANSDDLLSAPQGGDMDFFSRGTMEPAFDKAAFELKIQQVSDVIETSYGYHILKVTGHKDASTIPFEQAKDDIINQLTKEKQDEFAMAYINSLVESATIIYPPGKEPASAEPVLPALQ